MEATTGVLLTPCEGGDMIEGSFHQEFNAYVLRRITASREPILVYTLPDGWEKVDGRLS